MVLMTTIDVNSPVEVFSGSFWEAGIVKSLLENADIMVFLKDELLGSTTPWITVPGGTGAVTVVVSGKDYNKALEVVDGYSTACS